MPARQAWPAGQSFVCTHCTHWAAWHVGVGAAQSLFCEHSTHCPSGLQTLSVGDVQSLFERHATHDDVVVSHSGASPLHCVLEVHPPRHW